MVERLTVNQYVVGSSPTSGANLWCEKLTVSGRCHAGDKQIAIRGSTPPYTPILFVRYSMDTHATIEEKLKKHEANLYSCRPLVRAVFL